MSLSRRLRPELKTVARQTGRVMPRAAVEQLARRALDGLNVSLCLHRVSASRRPTDWQPELSIDPTELDATLELLLASRRGPRAGWLTVAFDDGYADAIEYVAERAPRFPEVEFAVFVCPEKLERRAGFRWDLVETELGRGVPRPEALGGMDAPVVLDEENARPELRALGDAAPFRLATVEAVSALRRFDNVVVGNHTNVHLKATSLSDELARDEYQRSTRAFERLFGELTQFAFPFGTPGLEFDERHVRLLRELGRFLVWTTESRPYRPEERRPGAVLPRFAVDGTLPHRELVVWIALRALLFATRGTPHAFPVD